MLKESNKEITDKYNYHYNYIITNLNNHKRYIGVRSCNCHPIEDNNYWGSCKTLLESIEKEGLEWFRKDVIAIWGNRELAVEHEIKMHNWFEVGSNPMFYNKAKQTSTGYDQTGCPGCTHSEEFIKYLRQINTGENNPWYNKKQTEESNRKRSETQTGNIWVHKGNKRAMVTHDKLDQYLNNGWQLGSNIHYYGEDNHCYGKKYVNKDGINKMIGPDEIEEHLENGWVLGMINNSTGNIKDKKCINKDGQNKYVEESELKDYLDNGWKLGSYKSKDHRGSKNPRYGKKCVNKNGKNKTIFPEEIDDYLNNGWQLGMIQNRNKD